MMAPQLRSPTASLRPRAREAVEQAAARDDVGPLKALADLPCDKLQHPREPQHPERRVE
jgi:hypothetical protein